MPPTQVADALSTPSRVQAEAGPEMGPLEVVMLRLQVTPVSACGRSEACGYERVDFKGGRKRAKQTLCP